MLPPFVLPVSKTCKSCPSLGLAKVSIFGYCLERQCCVWVAVSGVLSQLPVVQGFLTWIASGLVLAAATDLIFMNLLLFLFLIS